MCAGIILAPVWMTSVDAKFSVIPSFCLLIELGGAAAEAYEQFKRLYLDTASDCMRQGITFIPLIAGTLAGGVPPPNVSSKLLRALFPSSQDVSQAKSFWNTGKP